MSVEQAMDLILAGNKKTLVSYINQVNTNPLARWSPSEVREIAEIGLSMIHYIQKERQELEESK